MPGGRARVSERDARGARDLHQSSLQERSHPPWPGGQPRRDELVGELVPLGVEPVDEREVLRELRPVSDDRFAQDTQ
jgi:hypothetical protein